MKKLCVTAVLITVSGCSVLENAALSRSVNSSQPSDLVIDCNPTPELIYSKTGDLIETVYPILHPYCEGALGTTIVLPTAVFASAVNVAPDDREDDDDNRGFEVSSLSRDSKADDRNASTAGDDDRQTSEPDEGDDRNAEDEGDGDTNDDDTNAGDDSDSNDDDGSTKGGASCGAKGC